MKGSIEILSTGAGDVRIEFQEREGQKPTDANSVVMGEEAAVTVLRDLQKRGYAILVQMPDGRFARAVSIDADKACYRVRVPSEPAADEIEESPRAVHSAPAAVPPPPAGPAAAATPSAPTKKRGRSSEVALPVKDTTATAVARSAGG